MKRLSITIFIVLMFLSGMISAQEKPPEGKGVLVKTLRDIPHETVHQKWMWPHRCIAYFITKERPINYDTAYIKSYYKRLVVTLPLTSRFLRFSFTDFRTGNKLNFAPNLQSDLGIGISSRWATFIANTGVKVFSGDNSSKGKSTYQDYQLNLYGRKVTTDLYMQFYNGFYIRNSKSYASYVSSMPYELRSDVKTFNIGVSSYYIFNHRKFSFGGSFSFIEIQKKSAGSFLSGIYYSYFGTEGDSSLISSPFRHSFDSLSYLRSGQTQNFGINLGYIYTLVFLKRYTATASLNQGIGGTHVAYQRDDNAMFRKMAGGTGKLNVRLSLKYDNGRYFIGTMAMFDNFLSIGKSYSTFDYSFGKFMVFIGYRFSVLVPEKKLLRALKLIDY